jgi:general stress protein 26
MSGLSWEELMNAALGVYDVLNGFETAVMVTGSGNGHTACRLLRLAHVGDCGTIWLLAPAETVPGSFVLDRESVVLVLHQPERRHMWVSGTARRVSDPEQMAQLWDGPFRSRIGADDGPDGKVLLAVRPQRATAWDADSYPRHFIFP